jgi:hypothetical protein
MTDISNPSSDRTATVPPLATQRTCSFNRPTESSVSPITDIRGVANNVHLANKRKDLEDIVNFAADGSHQHPLEVPRGNYTIICTSYDVVLSGSLALGETKACNKTI